MMDPDIVARVNQAMAAKQRISDQSEAAGTGRTSGWGHGYMSPGQQSNRENYAQGPIGGEGIGPAVNQPYGVPVDPQMPSGAELLMMLMKGGTGAPPRGLRQIVDNVFVDPSGRQFFLNSDGHMTELTKHNNPQILNVSPAQNWRLGQPRPNENAGW